jgi:PAS domain S-box-containing protein
MAANGEEHQGAGPSVEQTDVGTFLPERSWTEIAWAADADGVIDWVERRGFASIAEPLVGQRWETVVHQDDRAQVKELWEQTRRSGAIFESEHRLPVSGGRYRWFLSRAWPLRDQTGRVDRWFGSSSDIEETKQAELAFLGPEASAGDRLETVPEPATDHELELAQLLDLRLIQPLLDTWYLQTRMSGSIQDTHGQHHYSATQWQRICSGFHKMNDLTRQRCLESDAKLAEGIPPGQWRIRQCKNRLWDIATPIVVTGKQIGTIFMGQFFVEGNEPDREIFRSQARRYGFDEDAYLAAFDEVPRLSREHVERAIALLVALSNMIAGLCYARLRMDRALTQYNDLSQLLRHQQEAAARVEAVAEIGSWTVETGTGRVSLSPEARKILALRSDVSPASEVMLERIDPRDREGVRSILRQPGAEPVDLDFRLSGPRGKHVGVRAWRKWAPDGRLAELTGTVRRIDVSQP